MTFCPVCGTQATNEAAFCSKCGAELLTTIAPYMQPTSRPAPSDFGSAPSYAPSPPTPMAQGPYAPNPPMPMAQGPYTPQYIPNPTMPMPQGPFAQYAPNPTMPMSQGAFQMVRNNAGQATPLFIAAASAMLLSFVLYFCPTIKVTALLLLSQNFSFVGLIGEGFPGVIGPLIIPGPIALVIALVLMAMPFIRRTPPVPRDLAAAIIASIYSLISVGISLLVLSSTLSDNLWNLAKMELTFGGWLFFIVAITAVVTALAALAKVNTPVAQAQTMSPYQGTWQGAW